MSSNKKSLVKKLITSNTVCGCNKPKPSDIYQPKPHPKHALNLNLKSPIQSASHHPSANSSTSFDPDEELDPDEENTSTTFSLNIDDTTENDPVSSKTASPLVIHRKKICRSSEAVVKDSDDPYADFRQSMLQMILEREIYSKEELKELLNCFLELNSPSHHEVIVQAFMEIWNGVVSKGWD